MKVRELMTKNPASVTPDDTLNKVASLMVEHNVGSIPVIENKDSQKIIGLVTDRDIAVRAVAKNMNPLQMKARDVMSSPVVTIHADDNIKDCAKLMEEHKVRRVPVVDEQGKIVGMVAQADIALKGSDRTTANVVEEISKPSSKGSSIR